MTQALPTAFEDRVLEDVLTLAKSGTTGLDGNGEPTSAFAYYVEQLVRYATGEDEIWAEPAAILKRAEKGWALGQTRKPGENKFSLEIEESAASQSRKLILSIITEDKPFLVDSISAALSEASRTLTFFSNAVSDIQRDSAGERLTGMGGEPYRESMIRAEMDAPVSDQEVAYLKTQIENVLRDVASAVTDWEPMRARLAACIAQLERSRIPGLKGDEQRESIEFLKWLWDNRFAFLGVRRITRVGHNGASRFEHDDDGDLGILRDKERRILRATFDEDGQLSAPVAAFLNSEEPTLIAKANSKSVVHRRVYMDYVGVKTYAIDGSVTGEERFVGLFTADAYNRPATDIPLIRAKVQAVLDGTRFNPGGHNEKALINILETYPRDELFQIDVPTLRQISLGVLRLFKRPRAKLFMRRDRFDRYISALVYVPRDRFNSDIREQIGDMIADAFDGRVSAYYPHFGEAALVRVHFIIGLNPGAPEGPSVVELTRWLREICRDWSDDLLEAMRARHSGSTPANLFKKYEHAFTEGYRDKTPLEQTLHDIDCLERLSSEDMVIRAYRDEGDHDHVVRLKIYRRNGPLPLSGLVPTIENLNLDIVQENGFAISPSGEKNSGLWIHDFYTEQEAKQPIDLDAVSKATEDALLAVLDGRTEDDGFNALVLTAGINWREAWLLRTAAKHNLQGNFSYSQSYMEETLANHPKIAKDLVTTFHARFDPDGPADFDERQKNVVRTDAAIYEALNDVASLDEDRIIRRFLNLFSATTRTNFYQRLEDGAPKPYISIKIESRRLEELPEPRPFREIFMSGPRVDGVHLRFGPVARGGLRWSDRREDFRTEVLGLVKAQRVKNAVIVPTGSKGGFYPKQLPVGGDRAKIFEEGREAYCLFIRSLLDITDNIVQGETVTPPNVVAWDEKDPYLVVAADKGTATFSDTANGIAIEYGFWLGDAFASGGSAGYDHKAMGITARGAWEAVKRHFREMGKNIQEEPFTVAGVGDMSGDVFGNGMLLSEQIRLVAAFDHRDIFIDPDPDPATSFVERKRLFETPRSTWQDYDASLISKGGGVFSRSAKSIPLSDEIRDALGVNGSSLTPHELIRAVLKTPVELFWLGGIGTYFKDAKEENWRVGDRANDPVRIDADEIGAKVIGEGANLGLTQRARIAFARRGGRINTDAIDNSAGVDSSDHEVNIKILLSAAIESGALAQNDRNDLLASMTDSVAEHVLDHNYDQTRALTLMAEGAPEHLDLHARFMTTLEREGRLNRTVEQLPTTEDIGTLRARALGLTRPELSVLLAYAKLWLFDTLVDSKTPDDPIFDGEVYAYFPEPLHRYENPIKTHQLRREIIATRLSNEIVDACGVALMQRIAETSGFEFDKSALAYVAVREIYDMVDYGAAVDALDNKTPADLQTDLYLEATQLLREQACHIMSTPKAIAAFEQTGLKAFIAHYRDPMHALSTALPEILPKDAAADFAARTSALEERGAPRELSYKAASLRELAFGLDIVDLAEEATWSHANVASIFFAVGQRFHIDALRDTAEREPPSDHFDKIALRQIVEDLVVRQRQLTRAIIDDCEKEPEASAAAVAGQLLDQWSEQKSDAVAPFLTAARQLDLSGDTSVGKSALFLRKLDDLIAAVL